MQHKSAYQVSASQVPIVANDDGSKSGVFCVVKEFCALEVEVEGEDQCAREKN